MDMKSLSQAYYYTTSFGGSFRYFDYRDVWQFIEGQNDEYKRNKLMVLNDCLGFYSGIAESRAVNVVETAKLVGPDIAPSIKVRDKAENSFEYNSKTSGLNMYKILTNLEGVDSPLWKMYSTLMKAVGTPINVEDTKIYKAAEAFGKVYLCICLNDERISKLKINKESKKILQEASEYYSEKFDDPRYVEVFNQKFGKDNPEIKTRKLVLEWTSACMKRDRYGVVQVEQRIRENTTDYEWFDFLCRAYEACTATNSDLTLMFPSNDIGDLLYKGVLMSTLKGWGRKTVFKMMTECPEDFRNIDADKTPKDPCLASLTALSKIGVSLTEAAYKHDV